MTVTLHYHALARERAGRAEEAYELPAGTRVGDLLERLRERRPELAALSRHCQVAVNDEFAEAARALAEGDRVDLLPPYGGG